MDLSHGDLVLVCIIIFKINSTHNLFNYFKNLYGFLKKNDTWWRKIPATFLDSIGNLLETINITTDINIAIIRGLTILFIKNHFFDI